MKGLLGIDRVRVPQVVVDLVHDFLRDSGQEGYEGIGLWVGHAQGNVFQVSTGIVPRQEARQGPFGLSVAIDGEELHRVNRWLYEHGLTAVAQVHSHPTEAYHSSTDDALTLVTVAGGLSVVVPDFAARDFTLDDCAVYRLSEDAAWNRLPQAKVVRLIEVTD